MRRILRLGILALRWVDRMLEVLIFDVLFAARNRALVLSGAAISAGLLLWSGTAISPAPSSEAMHQEFLFERPWLDHLPKDEHDKYQALLFDKENFGVTLQATAYRGQWELFLFKVKGKRMQILFPHDRRKAETGFAITDVQERNFDLALRIEDGPFGSKTYYSWKKFRRDDLGRQPLRSMALERWLLPASVHPAVDANQLDELE